MKALRWVHAVAVCMGLAFSVGCGGGSSSSSNTTTPPQTITPSGNNVAPISVNGGPLGNYADAAFVSVTICVPGTSNCQTIDNVLVDTGSSGLRVLSSVMTLPLPQQMSGGNPLVECFPFVSGNTWGPVQTADVEIAGEKASSVPIQVLNETAFNASGVCTAPQDDVESLLANGIIGVGLFAQDCGSPSCLAAYNVYFDCPPSGTCTAVTVASAQEVQNPVSLFATDNNGVILELPAVSGAEASVSGSLVFGIGTQSNNALKGATIYTADPYGNFTTTYNGTAYPASFIDSGSNGYYFLDSSITGIAECGGDESGFYCPSSTANISATNQGVNGASGAVSFSIEDANTLFNSNDSAYSDLGGISSTSAPYFDWGLPFFFGRNLYTGLQNSTYPNGYWAY
jgi:predicted aspartyl protease